MICMFRAFFSPCCCVSMVSLVAIGHAVYALQTHCLQLQFCSTLGTSQFTKLQQGIWIMAPKWCGCTKGWLLPPVLFRWQAGGVYRL